MHFHTTKLPMSDFFTGYPRFTKQTGLANSLLRLNKRYKAIIEWNKDYIADKSILDIASHDGRWAFAAIKSQARHVTCVEPRANHVKWIHSNMEHYEVDPSKYSVIQGDIHEEIIKFKKRQFDIIFCLGFFYHTIEHGFLVRQFKRLNPDCMILDTRITPGIRTLITLQWDRTKNGLNAYGSKKEILVGTPTKSALDAMFKWCKSEYFDWTQIEKAPSEYVGKQRTRVTVRFTL